MQVLNELNPVLGLELTATPQVEKGTRTIKFKNVVYEYSLAKAIKDGFVKVPYVATKKNFNPGNYRTDIERDIVKLEDGIRIHEDTKVKLDIFARNEKVRKVKPFVLVVAKDTNHTEELLNVIKSDAFFNGNYKDKVIIVHSNQSGAEKDENIEQLVSLEDVDNKTEIVVHVNMLKEGWDVNNLYTIIPLRTSASSTLTEQTIGRGLRLPYGETTGDDAVDRLTIVSHDKYDEIIRLANSADSLIRKENVIEIEEEELEERKEVITVQNVITDELESKKNEITSTENWQDDSEKVFQYATVEAKVTVYDTVFENVDITSYGATGISELKREEVKRLVINNYKQKLENDAQTTIEGYHDDVIKVIENNYDAIIEEITDRIIEIPRVSIDTSAEINSCFEDFDLDTKWLTYRPSDQSLLLTNLASNETTEIKAKVSEYMPENLERTLVSELLNKPEIDYDKGSELLFKLVGQAIEKLSDYLNEEEVFAVIKERKYNIAEYIYAQMKEHLRISELTREATKVRPFVRIEDHNYSKIITEDVLDYHQTVDASEMRKKVFTGFKKSCHKYYKFDSMPEKNLTVCLENSNEVLKWLRPAPNQFNIYWNRKGNRYEPDFIVETTDKILMVEVKRSNDINTEDVQDKKKAAELYCELVSEFNISNGKKPWKYIIIPDSEINFSRTFEEYINLFG